MFLHPPPTPALPSPNHSLLLAARPLWDPTLIIDLTSRDDTSDIADDSAWLNPPVQAGPSGGDIAFTPFVGRRLVASTPFGRAHPVGRVEDLRGAGLGLGRSPAGVEARIEERSVGAESSRRSSLGGRQNPIEERRQRQAVAQTPQHKTDDYYARRLSSSSSSNRSFADPGRQLPSTPVFHPAINRSSNLSRSVIRVSSQMRSNTSSRSDLGAEPETEPAETSRGSLTSRDSLVVEPPANESIHQEHSLESRRLSTSQRVMQVLSSFLHSAPKDPTKHDPPPDLSTDIASKCTSHSTFDDTEGEPSVPQSVDESPTTALEPRPLQPSKTLPLRPLTRPNPPKFSTRPVRPLTHTRFTNAALARLPPPGKGSTPASGPIHVRPTERAPNLASRKAIFERARPERRDEFAQEVRARKANEREAQRRKEEEEDRRRRKERVVRARPVPAMYRQGPVRS